MTENLYTKNSIRTFTGRYFNFTDIRQSDIVIEDIAHSLSMQCRFASHLPVFYSVAQHSVLAAEMSMKANKLTALLHDASEAFLMDVPSPIKSLPQMRGYVALEKLIQKEISKKFGCIFPIPKEVKDIDRKLLELEWDNIMLKKSNFPLWDQKKSEIRFLEYFRKLAL